MPTDIRTKLNALPMSEAAKLLADRDAARTVQIDVLGGGGGVCLVINGLRVAGPKAWGGGTVLHTFTARMESIREALEPEAPEINYRMWTISPRALADFVSITGRSSAELADCNEELRGYIWQIIESKKQPMQLASGDYQYRTGRPLRARLIVREKQGSLPELIEVRPDNEGRTRPYERSSNKHTRNRK